jgi:peptidoglycan-N-acetylglucosamine deacetylase
MGRTIGGLGARWSLLAISVAIAAVGPLCSSKYPSYGVPHEQLPVCGVQSSEKVIALTYDGGPGPFTHADLDLMERYGARATFFVTGKRMAGYPDAVRREVRLGMDVENHTWTHPVMTLLPLSAQRAEILRTQRALVAAGAPRPTLWRPPHGAADGQTIRLAHELGLRTVLWEHAVEIKVRYANPDPLGRAEDLAASIRPGQILLAHDSLPLSSTTETLRYLLPMLIDQGYRIVTVPDLLAVGYPVLGHARWGTEVDGQPVMRGACPQRWPNPAPAVAARRQEGGELYQ